MDAPQGTPDHTPDPTPDTPDARPTEGEGTPPAGDATPSPARPVRARPVREETPPPVKVPQRTRVKICGITRWEDAEHAVEHGAWAVGLIFWRGSSRRCRFEQAQLIGARLKRQAEVVGVFVNATLDSIDRAVDACSLTIVQLHGDEGPSYCAEVERRTGAQVIKAARVRTASDVIALRPFHVDYHLLDTYVEGVRGGTGMAFDRELARVRRAATGERQPKLILSGGLNPETVAEAVVEVRPYAVDVASGVESAPGIKDQAKVAAFISAAQSAWDTTPLDGPEPSESSATATAGPADGTPSAAPAGSETR